MATVLNLGALTEGEPVKVELTVSAKGGAVLSLSRDDFTSEVSSGGDIVIVALNGEDIRELAAEADDGDETAILELNAKLSAAAPGFGEVLELAVELTPDGSDGRADFSILGEPFTLIWDEPAPTPQGMEWRNDEDGPPVELSLLPDVDVGVDSAKVLYLALLEDTSTLILTASAEDGGERDAGYPRAFFDIGLPIRPGGGSLGDIFEVRISDKVTTAGEKQISIRATGDGGPEGSALVALEWTASEPEPEPEPEFIVTADPIDGPLTARVPYHADPIDGPLTARVPYHVGDIVAGRWTVLVLTVEVATRDANGARATIASSGADDWWEWSTEGIRHGRDTPISIIDGETAMLLLHIDPVGRAEGLDTISVTLSAEGGGDEAFILNFDVTEQPPGSLHLLNGWRRPVAKLGDTSPACYAVPALTAPPPTSRIFELELQVPVGGAEIVGEPVGLIVSTETAAATGPPWRLTTDTMLGERSFVLLWTDGKAGTFAGTVIVRDIDTLEEWSYPIEWTVEA